MLKSNLTYFLPEFNGTDVDDEMLQVLLDGVQDNMPTQDYIDEAKAKAYYVAMAYFNAQSRASALDGSSNIKSEKIDDIATTFKDGSTANPYEKLFYANIVKESEFDLTLGFMVSS